ncbi:MAG: DUF2071 domain-containing protein [Ferruginibacter sp.]
MPSKFLSAEWKYLIMANYAVDPEILKPYLPAKTELDIYEGNCFISLVGFLFHNTKVAGISIPFHKNFEEINLRFYVKYNNNGIWKRGVVFISEVVPKPAIALIANTLFNEKYRTHRTKNSLTHDDTLLSVRYQWRHQKKWNSISVKAETVAIAIPEGSHEEFITEHYWGYSPINKLKTGEYKVEHPRWEIFPVISYEINCDFKAMYGNEFSFLQNIKPNSVLLAKGSAVTVSKRKII